MKLSITFKSDWHIGSGSGIPGSIDRTILRDENGLPFIPGKTITGLLRDSAEFVASNLQNSKNWEAVVDSLFGTQPKEHYGSGKGADGVPTQKAKLNIKPAKFSCEFTEAICKEENKGQKAELTFLQPGVSICHKTGRAEDKKLFFTEMVRGGVSLTSTIEASDGPALSENEKALLLAAAKGLRRLGGGRRRGAGDCVVSIEDLNGEIGDSYWDTLDKGTTVEGSSDSDSDVGEGASADEKGEEQGSLTGGKFQRYRITVTTRQPLIVAAALKGNVLESRNWIPGGMLLPVMLKAFGGHLKCDAFSAITRGDFIVTNCLPQPKSENDSHPAPCCYSIDKEPGEDGTRRRYNLNAGEKAKSQVKPIRSGWIGISGETGHFMSADDLMTRRMHNTVHDDSQRPTEAVGGIFTYEAIKSGTVLVGEVRIRESILEEKTVPEEFCTSLGRSRKDDYGDVTIKFTEEEEEEGGALPKPKLDGDSRKTLTIWLQSPLLIRNKLGHYSARPEDLIPVLKQALGFQGNIEFIGGWGRAERIESWHGPSNLPRASLVGLAAGGVYKFCLNSPDEGQFPETGILETIQYEGLGDRRAEGFGQVLINHDLVTKEYKPDQWKTEDNEGPDGRDSEGSEKLSPEEMSLLRRLDILAWQEAIRSAARRKAFEIDKNPLFPDKKKPTNSQAGALLQAAGMVSPSLEISSELTVVGEEDLDPIRAWAEMDAISTSTPKRTDALRAKRERNLEKKWETSLERVTELLPEAVKKVWDHLGSLDINPASDKAWKGYWPKSVSDGKSLMRPFAVKTLIEQCIEARLDIKHDRG